ncbi:MAG: hypothetical protein WA624_15420 [Methylocella sp.]
MSRACAAWLPFRPQELLNAHVIGDKAEQAYRRGDALEKRRALMEAWANYCEPEAGSNVVKLRESRAISSGRTVRNDDNERTISIANTVIAHFLGREWC